jgi:serine/threonine protein kinase
MPRQLKPHDRIRDYTIEKHLNTGAMANAFAAVDAKGKRVFLKSYKSPTCAVSWYRSYVDYQKELKRRLESHTVGKFCVRLIDQFEFKFGVSTFFQVFEFIHGGEDLEQILVKLRRNPRSLDWNQRHILAKVMMAAIHQLHDAKIVHGDLKPPNLQLFKDPDIRAGYQLKLIDMDFSILSDRRAPWHGHSAYVGTPGYFSPEHLAGGASVPGPASDIFTCGLILYELLGPGHPYRFDDDSKYLSAVKANVAKKPALLGTIDGDAKKTEVLIDVLHSCLAPAPAQRPTASDVHKALIGHLEHKTLLPPPSPKTSSPSESLPRLKQSLQLTSPTGIKMNVGVTTPFGKALLKPFGEDANFADALQFVLERRDGAWWVVPPPGSTRNLTMLNGEPLDSPKRLNDKDKLALGSRTIKGKTVLPLTVSL